MAMMSCVSAFVRAHGGNRKSHAGILARVAGYAEKQLELFFMASHWRGASVARGAGGRRRLPGKGRQPWAISRSRVIRRLSSILV